MTHRLLLGFLASSMASGVFAADWPQWRGPNRDGRSTETGLLKMWPEGGPKLAWKLDDVGTGYGSPAVIGDRIYLIGGSSVKQDSKDSVTCLSAKDGGKIWTKEFGTTAGKYLDGWGGGPRATPTVDGDFLYVLGATGDLACLKMADGAIVWSKNLVSDFDGKIPQWGYSESVLIDGDAAVVTPGNGTTMVAFNKKTGNVIWKSQEMKDGAGYSSIMIATIGDVKTYVQQTMASAIGVRANDGKLLWKTGEIGRRIAVIPTPVIDGSLAFFTAGYGAGCELVEMKADGKGGVSASLKYTKNKTLANHHGGVIQDGNYIFGHSDAGGWTCLDFKKEGEATWQYSKHGKGSITYADGRFYCYSEAKGDLCLIEADPKEWKEVGKLSLPSLSSKRPGNGKVWPHPVIANGKLYLRDFEKMFVFNISSAAE